MIVVKNVGTQIFGLGMTGGATPGLFDGGAEGGPGAENGGDSCLEGDVWINIVAVVGVGGGCVDIHDCCRRIGKMVDWGIGGSGVGLKGRRRFPPRDCWREPTPILILLFTSFFTNATHFDTVLRASQPL